MPAPVAPPPTTSTSVCRVVIPSRLPGYGPSRRDLFVLEPVEGPRDRLLPVLEVLLALARVHLGLPALVLLPVLAQVLDLAPEPDRETGGIGGDERRRLGHLRP